MTLDAVPTQRGPQSGPNQTDSRPQDLEQRVRKEVVSFVRRSTRMRPKHEHTLAEFGSAYLLEVPRRAVSTSVAPGSELDLTAAFGRAAPLAVEIGSGTGESLAAVATARPELNIVAIEVYLPGIARTVARLHESQLTNVRLIQADAVAVLRQLFTPGSVAEVWTFFPDPWPKSRHHKRRLVNAEFTDLIASRLTPGGDWRLATDWSDYAIQMRELLSQHPDLESLGTAGDGWATRWPGRPITKFEHRGLTAGRHIYDVHYRRRTDGTATDPAGRR